MAAVLQAQDADHAVETEVPATQGRLARGILNGLVLVLPLWLAIAALISHFRHAGGG